MNSLAWYVAVRFAGDRYALGLLLDRELQLAALDEFAHARGRTWVTLAA